MRDYALTQADAAGCLGVSLRSLFANWKARRDTAVLATCDDRTLAQIGLTRADLDRVLRLPLTQNARLALEQCAFLRSRM